MSNLVQLGLYEYVWNHPPLPAEALLAKVASPHARRTYQQAIEIFYWRVERDPCQATPPAIAEYLGVICNCYPPRTAALHLRIIGELYDAGVAAGIVATNPVRAVRPPEFSAEPPVRVPSRDAAERRLPACSCHYESGRRERALCLTVCRTAIRAEEVTGLVVSDFSRQEERAGLSVRQAEGRAPLHMGLPDEAADALDAYLAGRAVADDSPLFGLPRCRAGHGHPVAGGPGPRRPAGKRGPTPTRLGLSGRHVSRRPRRQRSTDRPLGGPSLG